MARRTWTNALPTLGILSASRRFCDGWSRNVTSGSACLTAAAAKEPLWWQQSPSAWLQKGSRSGCHVTLNYKTFSTKLVFIWVLTPGSFSPVLQLDETLLPFRLSQEQLLQVKARMRAGLETGLKATGPSAIKMLPAFVFRKPDGSGQIFIHSHESFLQSCESITILHFL